MRVGMGHYYRKKQVLDAPFELTCDFALVALNISKNLPNYDDYLITFGPHTGLLKKGQPTLAVVLISLVIQR